MTQPRRISAFRKWHGPLAVLILTSSAVFSCSPHVAMQVGKRDASDPSGRPFSSEHNLAVFDTAWKLVEERYYDEEHRDIDWEALKAKYRSQADTASSEASLYATLARMTGTLKDGHTRVESPDAVSLEEGQVDVGLGVRGKWVEDKFVIAEVSPDSPADRAGVQAGWVLTEWDDVPFGQYVARYSQYVVKEGQTVRLLFADANDTMHEVHATGRFYPRHDPQNTQLLHGGHFYIRFDRFTDDAAQWFTEMVAAHRDAPGLVIDLRNNRGGQLSALKRMLSSLYREDLTVGTVIRRGGKAKDMEVEGAGRKAFPGGVVVLVDRSSQSAAEVFAAAIQESGRGTVVGRTTAGNVLVSHREELPDGGELRISTRDYVTSGGRRLEGQGVSPNVRVDPTLADLRNRTDLDVEMALTLLNGTWSASAQ